MDITTLKRIEVIKEQLQLSHPHWPQQKIEWIARQACGVLPTRKG